MLFNRRLASVSTAAGPHRAVPQRARTLAHRRHRGLHGRPARLLAWAAAQSSDSLGNGAGGVYAVASAGGAQPRKLGNKRRNRGGACHAGWGASANRSTQFPGAR